MANTASQGDINTLEWLKGRGIQCPQTILIQQLKVKSAVKGDVFLNYLHLILENVMLSASTVYLYGLLSIYNFSIPGLDLLLCFD
jgi:hypothetical protein